MMYEQRGRQVRLPKELFELDLNHNEIAIYAFLMYCEDHRKGLCYPSYSTIGRRLGMCKNTVRKYVASLESKHLIKTEQTQVIARGKKRNGNLKYTFLPIQEAEQYYVDMQIEAAKLEKARQKAEKKLEALNRTNRRRRK